MKGNNASTFVALAIFVLVLYLFRNSIASIFNKTAVGASSSSIATFGAPVVPGDLEGIHIAGTDTNPNANPYGIDWSKVPGGIIATS